VTWSAVEVSFGVQWIIRDGMKKAKRMTAVYCSQNLGLRRRSRSNGTTIH
jgi:hypothetical protein